jgi:hypothetical protein
MKIKTLVIVGASLLSTTMAFVVSRNDLQKIIISKQSMVSQSEVSRDVLSASAPPKARDIWTVLSTRYSKEATSSTGEGNASTNNRNADWTKTRNYIYHTVDKLPLSQVQDVCEFLESHFDNALIANILQSSPRILRKNVVSNLTPTTKFLKQLYGDDLFQKAVSRNPDLLLSTGLGYNGGSGNYESVERYLRDDLELPPSKLKKFSQSAPFFFQIPLIKIQQVAEFLTDLLDKGDQDAAPAILQKVMMQHPHLFHLSVDTNLQPRIEFLRAACQLSDKHVATLIKSSSGILGLSVQDNLKPTLDYLTDLFVVDDSDDDEIAATRGREALHKCIMSHPAILALSQRNIESKVDYFNAIDCTTDSGFSLAARIALRSPVVYSLSLTDNIVPTVEFLSKIWGTPAPPTVQCRDSELCILTDDAGSSNDGSLGMLLRDYPSVLTLSLEGNLQPTLHFYNKTGYTSLTEDWELISSPDANQSPSAQPKVIRGRYIAASLFHRLLPRWHYWMSAKKDQQSGAIKPPLHAMVGATDATFCKLLGLDLHAYLEFKQESASRLKFSSQFDTWLKTGRAIDI